MRTRTGAQTQESKPYLYGLQHWWFGKSSKRIGFVFPQEAHTNQKHDAEIGV